MRKQYDHCKDVAMSASGVGGHFLIMAGMTVPGAKETNIVGRAYVRFGDRNGRARRIVA